jgi:prophage antirepressor-like protein
MKKENELYGLKTYFLKERGQPYFKVHNIEKIWGCTNLTQKVRRELSDNDVLLVSLNENKDLYDILISEYGESNKSRKHLFINESGLLSISFRVRTKKAKHFIDYVVNSMINLREKNIGQTSNILNHFLGSYHDENYNKKTYLIVDEKTNLVKIGASLSPNIREKTLQSECPFIKLLYVLDRNIEKELHKHYKSKRERGEWFLLNDEDISDLIDMGFMLVV